jgi:hypothetical protein
LSIHPAVFAVAIGEGFKHAKDRLFLRRNAVRMSPPENVFGVRL